MDTTPISQRISELADQDPAEAVDAAEALADELEASLAEPADDEAEPAGAEGGSSVPEQEAPERPEGEHSDAQET